MSDDEEKKTFVMNHVFTDVKNLENDKYHFGPREKHFGVPWRICIFKSATHFHVSFECLKSPLENDWSISTTITLIIPDRGEEIENRIIFHNRETLQKLKVGDWLNSYVVGENLDNLECNVTIHNMTGIEEPILMNFNEESEFSDVVLVVKDQKFHVNKMYLAGHSTFFEALFCGNFDESKQSEVELKDIEPEDFQKFLEVFYGEPAIDDDNIEGILQLADMYDAKTVIRQCEDFLIFKSEKDSKIKFDMALKYNMRKLQKKCILELKSVEDIDRIIPEDATFLNKDTSNQLLKLAISFHKKN